MFSYCEQKLGPMSLPCVAGSDFLRAGLGFRCTLGETHQRASGANSGVCFKTARACERRASENPLLGKGFALFLPRPPVSGSGNSIAHAIAFWPLVMLRRSLVGDEGAQSPSSPDARRRATGGPQTPKSDAQLPLLWPKAAEDRPRAFKRPPRSRLGADRDADHARLARARRRAETLIAALRTCARLYSLCMASHVCAALPSAFSSLKAISGVTPARAAMTLCNC